jgi:O-antigen ligase
LGFLAIIVAGLIGAQSAGVHLPLTAQRALSFLPGDWDNQAKSAAEESSDWRFYMWQVALNSNEFIKNKLLGDGFGFSGYELQIMNQAEDSDGGNGYVGGDPQEAYMIVGAFHSGPISAIRYVGWVGLALYLALLFAAAGYAWRLMRAAASTPFLPLALFIGLPAVFEPIRYIFIYGAYDAGFPETIFVCGMLRLLSKALAAWPETQHDLAGQFAPPQARQVESHAVFQKTTADPFPFKP